MASSFGKTFMWGGIFVLVLLSLIVPPVNLITVHGILIPLLIMATISDRIKFAVAFAVILVAPVILLGNFGLFVSIMALFYLPAALAMSYQYRKEAGALPAIIAGTIAFIVTMLVALLIAYAFHFSPSTFIKDALEQDARLLAMLETMAGTEVKLDLLLDTLVAMVPVTIIIFSLYTTAFAHFVARRILSRIWRPVPKLSPMKEWRLPKSIVWYYLILLLADLFLKFETGTTMDVILLNAYPLLTYSLALQGIGFLFFVASVKGWNRALPIAGIVLMLLMPPLVAWVGIMDTAFPLRKRLDPKE